MTGQLLRDKNRGLVGLAVMALGLFPGDAEMIAQQRRLAAKSTMASVLDAQLRALESQFVPAAEAMPADKYSFVPTMGQYDGVRTFALEVKHVATANMNTRLALATWGCAHAWDHYGQVVGYLRSNGIIPPASRGQPRVNASGD